MGGSAGESGVWRGPNIARVRWTSPRPAQGRTRDRPERAELAREARVRSPSDPWDSPGVTSAHRVGAQRQGAKFKLDLSGELD